MCLWRRRKYGINRYHENSVCPSCGEFKHSDPDQEYFIQKLVLELDESKRFNSGLAFINDDLEKRLEKQAVDQERIAKVRVKDISPPP